MRPASSRRPGRHGRRWQSSFGSPIVGDMRATSEHELKLDAPAGFRLPPLGGRPLAPRVFTSVYYDVPGESLTAVGITLRRRTENGHGVWQLKLPADDSRLELEAEGGPGQPPEELLALLHAHLRRGPLERVAELRTHRSGELVDAQRYDGRGNRGRGHRAGLPRRECDHFVEVEIELRDGSPDALDEIADELVSAGAEQGSGLPKLFRALGRLPGYGPSPRSFEELRSRLRDQLREIERTIRARGSAATPRAFTTCASASAACEPFSARGGSSSRPTPASSTAG